MTRPSVLLFDVIETVFSLDALRAALPAAGLRADDLETVFAVTLRQAFALASAGGYAPFPDILRASLDEVLVKRGMQADAAARDAVVAAMQRLDPQPDAREAFETARRAGLEVQALSNGAQAASEALLERAGLRDLVAGVHSVEAARSYKPDRRVYESALQVMSREPSDVMMVAAHAWDCHGAKRAGLRTSFVARGLIYPGFFEAPDIVGETLSDVVRQAVSIG